MDTALKFSTYIAHAANKVRQLLRL